MKNIKGILIKVSCIGLLLMSQLPTYAQNESLIDTTKFINIIYPPLTIREGKGLNIPKPPNEHPRVFFRKKDIPLLQDKLSNPLMSLCWDRINDNAHYKTNGILKKDSIVYNLDMRVINAIEAKAFLSIFSDNKTLGKEAIDAIINFNKTLIINANLPDVCRDMGRGILATALVYDWCYDLLSEKQKLFLISSMETWATRMEIEWPKLKQSSVSGHGAEAQVSRDMLACGIATYNEKPDIYNRAAGRLLAELIPARNFWYTSFSQPQGSSYGPYRYQWEIYTTLLFDRMGFPNIVDTLQGKVPYRWLYTRRPDGQLLRDGDDFSEQFIGFGEYWKFARNAYAAEVNRDTQKYKEPLVCPLAYAASYYNDAILMFEAKKQNLIGKNPLFDLLLVNPNLDTYYHLSSAPLSKFFPKPLNSMIARTGWKTGFKENTVVAEMKIGNYYFAGHQHLDAGSFQLYYKAPLAVQSGIYQGTKGGYGSSHFKNYYQRSIAHNTMLIYNPNEQFKWHGQTISNDGGQRYPNDAIEPENLEVLLNKDYKIADVLAQDFGPDTLQPAYTYIKGELKQAYTDKVKGFTRSFVFLNLNKELDFNFDTNAYPKDTHTVPAALIVFDKVDASNKDFKKTWLLHCVEEPTIEGNKTSVKRNEKGYNGQLINTTLLPLPNNLIINKTGGKGNEFTVNGQNYPQRTVADNNSNDSAVWRLEISPKNASESDNFLNVMQVMDYDNGKNKELPIEKIETEQFVGVKISDRMVFFSKTNELIKQTINLTIKDKNTLNILITDLEKGNWTIENNKNKKIIHYTVTDKHLIYFQATEGDYIISNKPELIFQTGFEGTSEVVKDMNTNDYGAKYEHLTGVDNTLTTKNNWDTDWKTVLKKGVLQVQYTGGDSTKRFAKVVAEPNNPTNHVLHYWLNDSWAADGGALKSRIQTNLYGIKDGLKEFYQSVRVFLTEDFNALKNYPHAITWCTLSEFWNNEWWVKNEKYGFRITLGIGKPTAETSVLNFILNAENGYPNEIWNADNPKVKVPIGKWFTLDYYFKEGNKENGRVVVSITPDGEPKQIVADVTNFTHCIEDPNPNGFTGYNPMKLYTSKELIKHVKTQGKTLQIYWDDFKLWKNKRP